MSTRAIDTARTNERLSAFLSEIEKSQPVDNVFVDLPTLDYFMKSRQTVNGGRQLLVPLDTAKNSTVMRFSDYDQFDTTAQDTAKTAVYAYKNYGATIVISWEEIREVAGSDHAIFDLIEHKRRNALQSLKDFINEELYKATPDSKGINSLPYIINIDRSLGGIDSTSETWWDAQVNNTGGAFSSVGLTQMRQMINDIKATGAGMPDQIFTTSDIHEAFEAEVDPDVRYVSIEGGTANRGFTKLMWKGIPVDFDSDCPSGSMYFLNKNWLRFKVDSEGDFSADEFRSPTNQKVSVSKLCFRGQLITDNPRGLGVINGLT